MRRNLLYAAFVAGLVLLTSLALHFGDSSYEGAGLFADLDPQQIGSAN